MSISAIIGHRASGESTAQKTGHSRLVVLEHLFVVALLKVVGHGVCPLERHAALDDLIDSLARELNFNPCQVRGDLHLLHLLLGLGVQIEREAGRLLVVRPAIVVLNAHMTRIRKKQTIVSLNAYIATCMK